MNIESWSSSVFSDTARSTLSVWLPRVHLQNISGLFKQTATKQDYLTKEALPLC